MLRPKISMSLDNPCGALLELGSVAIDIFLQPARNFVDEPFWEIIGRPHELGAVVSNACFESTPIVF